MVTITSGPMPQSEAIVINWCTVSPGVDRCAVVCTRPVRLRECYLPRTMLFCRMWR